jgi:hypothetical protein
MRRARILAVAFAILFVASAFSTGGALADGTGSGGYTTNSVTWCRTC